MREGPRGQAGGTPPREEVEACPACAGTRWRTEVEVRAQMHPEPEPFTFVRCDSCGLVFLNPRVPAATLGRYYTEAYLPYRGPGAWGPFAPLVAAGLRATDRKRVRLVRRHARVGAGTRVLDVGCGRPTFLEALVRETGCHGVGTDFSDAGWRDDPARWQGLELRTGELAQLSFDAPLEVVTMWHYLEHDYDPAGTLARVRELVETGGEDGRAGGTPSSGSPSSPRLIIEVPDHDSWTRRRHGRWWAGYHAPRHTALYTPHSLGTLLKRTGWTVVEVMRHGTLDPYVLHWMSRMERRGADWTGSMAPRFPGFLLGKLASAPRFAATRGRGMGIMTAVARPA